MNVWGHELSIHKDCDVTTTHDKQFDQRIEDYTIGVVGIIVKQMPNAHR